MEWSINNDYYYGFKGKCDFKKIGSFDLDDTIIKVKSGSKFANNSSDWEFLYGNTVDKLESLNKDGYTIIIISNQAGIGKKKQDGGEWRKKVDDIVKNFNFPIIVYASINSNIYRKPMMTFWNKIKTQETIIEDSFYCGDACGRVKDHSDTDYKFALNCNLKFYTPEELFLNKKIVLPQINYTKLPLNENKNNTTIKIDKEDKEMILMIGIPGSGKTTFSKNYYSDYQIINMDTLKTKVKCLKECEKQLKLENNVVIDNTNMEIISREDYISLAKKYNYTVKAIIVNCDYDVAYHNNLYRSYKSNGQIKQVPMIAYHKFKKLYEAPTKNEGIKDVININFIPPVDSDYYKFYH